MKKDFTSLQHAVCDANIALATSGLVILTWGNVSGFDGEHMAIKPSGVDYKTLTAEDIPILDLSGNVLFGQLKPSSDTKIHLELYRSFPQLRAIAHTHSRYAVAWSQSGRDIPCYGTTHADVFCGSVPCTDTMTFDEVTSDYELNTGRIAVRKLREWGIEKTSGVLIRNHGPFVWGATPTEAVNNSIALEEIAAMALFTELISSSEATPIDDYLINKHFFRKHGKDAYYGQ